MPCSNCLSASLRRASRRFTGGLFSIWVRSFWVRFSMSRRRVLTRFSNALRSLVSRFSSFLRRLSRSFWDLLELVFDGADRFANPVDTVLEGGTGGFEHLGGTSFRGTSARRKGGRRLGEAPEE